jgi:site-specific recombinase
VSRDFSTIRNTIHDTSSSTVEKLAAIISFIRPDNPHDFEQARLNMRYLADNLLADSKTNYILATAFHTWILNSNISTNLSSIGILSKSGLGSEFLKRFYNKFLPAPPSGNDFDYLFATLFDKQSDYLWVCKIPPDAWISLLKIILNNPDFFNKTKDHFFYEILYAFEILSVWIASEEFDENFIRLDKSLLNKDSAFIALMREVTLLCAKLQNNTIHIQDVKEDFDHIEVLLEQCQSLILSLRKKAVLRGISLALTYEFERLEQIIVRTKKTLFLIENFGSNEFYKSLVELFYETVKKNSTKNSLKEILSSSAKILAKSITNNTSEHGEHYITETKKEYFEMFFSSAGAGIIIAFMALLKIYISKQGFSYEFQTILTSLNYGLGFVLIHLLGFTVATKQPAMTASTFAKAVHKQEDNRTDQLKLIELIFQVSRSQFAAISGNVALAIIVAFGIGIFYFYNDLELLSANKAQYYLKSIHPFPALLYAAIAGFWLFFSGVISGYFDNRADLLNLQQRYYYHPILKKITSSCFRKKAAKFLHENHGAIAGNFAFGLLLGITPYVGTLLGLPLEIRHVAFSSANFGFFLAFADISWNQFVLVFISILLIGVVNLIVSFTLALGVSLRAQGAVFGSFWKFLKLLIVQLFKRPKELFYPPNPS